MPSPPSVAIASFVACRPWHRQRRPRTGALPYSLANLCGGELPQR